MGKRVRISNEIVNCYGFRVLTAGIDVEQYKRNPVLLYMHERGNVVGYVKDPKVENDEITGELMFDCASEQSERCQKQFEFGSLRMVSAGLEIIETSEDPTMLVPGQTRPTITKSRLFEVSVADVGANDDAIVLEKDGKRIMLSKDGTCGLPLITHNNNQSNKDMEQKVIALQLGLPETATENEINAKLAQLKALQQENETLKAEKQTLAEARIAQLVDTAIAEKRLDAQHKEQFVKLGGQIGAEELEKTLQAMKPQVKLSAILGHQGSAPGSASEKTYTKLSEVPAEELVKLRADNVEEYKRLYEAEYGIACEL
jgi:caudovirus prohead protease|nr:MAG TPA: prohead serine protease [Caudoviricetes sp.]